MLTRQVVHTPFGTKLEYYLGNEAFYSEYANEIFKKKRNILTRLSSNCCALIAGALTMFWPFA